VSKRADNVGISVEWTRMITIPYFIWRLAAYEQKLLAHQEMTRRRRLALAERQRASASNRRLTPVESISLLWMILFIDADRIHSHVRNSAKPAVVAYRLPSALSASPHA